MNNAEKEPQLIDLFSQEYENKFKVEGKIYKRKIEAIKGARQVAQNETIETRLPDGTLESTQDANETDWVITGSKGEEFVFTDTKFHGLYDSDNEGGWIPKERKIVALQNPTMMPVRINAPWGGTQDGSEKAMLVTEIGPDGTYTKDRYIIGDQEMLLNNYDPEETKE